jgi:uncharacterized membrane protein (UPF0127 family)
MAMRAALFVLSLVAATCQRVDEPLPGNMAEPTPTAESAPKPAAATPLPAAPRDAGPTTATLSGRPDGSARSDSGATIDAPPDAGRCIQPLVEPPPPVAKPATSCPADTDAVPPVLRHGSIAALEAKGAPVIDVEIADTPATEQRGLMFRTKLGAEQGMIFVWPKESIRTFWMHNTCLPLDMLFLALDGTVVGLLEQVPTLNDRPRQVRCPAAYVLEVNAGWSRRHGVKPGMKLDLKL